MSSVYYAAVYIKMIKYKIMGVLMESIVLMNINLFRGLKDVKKNMIEIIKRFYK